MTPPISNQNMLELLYGRRFPEHYRKADEPSLYLKRYLQSLIEGGITPLAKDAQNIINLVDPDKCPEEFLQYFIESFGLPYFNDIPSIYQRRILANIGELYIRRGTYSGVRFLAKVLTQMDCDLDYYRGYVDPYGEIVDDPLTDPEAVYGRYLFVTLLAKSTEDVKNRAVSTKVMIRYLTYFVPYYITIKVKAVIATQELESDIYRLIANSMSKHYDLTYGAMPII